MTASSTIQENPINLSHLLRNTCPLFLLLMLLMETKQFNFVCENVLLWRGVARKKKLWERNWKNSNSLSNLLVLLGGRTWGLLMGQVQEHCRNILQFHLLGVKENFYWLNETPMSLQCGGLSFSREWLMGFSGLLHDSPDMDSGGEALLSPRKRALNSHSCAAL